MTAACQFSSTAAATPECSAEVESSSLVPSKPGVEASPSLPATGAHSALLIIAGCCFILAGYVLGQLTNRAVNNNNNERTDR